MTLIELDMRGHDPQNPVNRGLARNALDRDVVFEAASDPDPGEVLVNKNAKPVCGHVRLWYRSPV